MAKLGIIDREHEHYLHETRDSMLETFEDWHNRIEEIHRMIRGEWSVRYPDGSVKTMDPLVMNLLDTMPRDVARLVSESAPSVNARPLSDNLPDISNATVREQIAETYWEANKGELLVPQHTMDLVVTGAALQTIWYDSSSPYPKITRLDPQYCYPDIVNGMMTELLVIQPVKGRVARHLWQDVDFGADDKDTDEFWEIWTHYTNRTYTLAVAKKSKSSGSAQENGVNIIDYVEHELGCIPATLVQMPSPDGAFRGLLDQVKTSLTTRNRIIEYLLEYAHHMVYAPWESKGILNADEEPGPTTRYDHNPDLDGETFMRRVQPAGPAPQLFGLLSDLEQEQRAQVAYPGSRQGEVPQDRASASFVASTQGQLTSVVRDIQRLLADLRVQTTYAAMKIDEHAMDYEKPLRRAVSGQSTYVPSKDIAGNYDVEVFYGSGAGIDRQSNDVRLMQYYGNGIIGVETVLENMDFVHDAQGEIEKRQREEISRAILQRFAGDPNVSLDFIITVYQLQQQEGLSLIEAISKASEQQATTEAQAQAEAEAQAAQQAPTTIQEQADQVAAAEQQGGPAIAPISPFSPPPLPQVFTSNR